MLWRSPGTTALQKFEAQREKTNAWAADIRVRSSDHFDGLPSRHRY
jgi:hypothetical protein